MEQRRHDHLPQSLRSKEEWDRLYAFNSNADALDFSENEWQIIPIPEGVSAEGVYRLLPSAPDFEYGGYLSENKIHFVRCDPTSANSLHDQPCTFHSHPTDIPETEPDMPSASDLYSFLKWRHLRSVTVGKTIIWVFDKTEETMPIIEWLGRWERKNMLRVYGELGQKSGEDTTEKYKRCVLEELGMTWPERFKDVSNEIRSEWPQMIRSLLKIDVKLIPIKPS